MESVYHQRLVGDTSAVEYRHRASIGFEPRYIRDGGPCAVDSRNKLVRKGAPEPIAGRDIEAGSNLFGKSLNVSLWWFSVVAVADGIESADLYHPLFDVFVYRSIIAIHCGRNRP